MITEVKDIAILTELDKKFAEMATTLPSADVDRLEQHVNLLAIENDQDFQTAVDLGVKVNGWVARVENFWESWREHYFRRYKAVMAVTKDGITTTDADGKPVHTIVGTARLAEIRKKIEHAMRAYKIRRERDAATQQQRLDSMVAQNRAGVEQRIQDALLEGDMAEVRRLRHEAENIHPVEIMRQPVKSEGAGTREPYRWVLDEDEGLMKVIKAIASGEVALFHEITIKGKTERRALVELSSVVLNAKTREMGPQLAIPGITVTQEVNFAFRKTGTEQ